MSVDTDGVVPTGPGLASLRAYHGVKQCEVARQMGLNAARLCRLERGYVAMTPETAVRIRTAIIAVLDERAQRFLRAAREVV